MEGSNASGVRSTAGFNRDSNAHRDVDRLIHRFGLMCKVPRDVFLFEAADGQKILEVPWIRPTSWVRYLMQSYPALLTGVQKGMERQLESFWKCYQNVQPGHVAYQNPSRLKYTLPLLLHGDEGRYLKRSNYMICTVESVFGSEGHVAKQCDCSKDPVLQRYADLDLDDWSEDAKVLGSVDAQRTTMKGHCYLSRFLLFGTPTQQYKENPGLLDKAFALVAEDLTQLVTEGICLDNGSRIYAGFLGVKGDMKFHHQVGHLTRSYYNLGKRRHYPICHLCLAGAPQIPFESVDDHPEWEDTLFKDCPWDENAVPSLASIPFDPLCAPAIFRLDPFHLWKVGTGRDLCGSTIAVLAQLGKFDFFPEDTKNIEDRLNRAHNCFRLFCEGSRYTPALRTFSKNLLNYPDAGSYAWCNTKGSDTILLTKWLLFYLSTHMAKAPDDPHRLLKAMTQSLESALVFFNVVNKHGLWLHRRCAQRAQHHLTRAIRGYKVCSAECLKLGIAGYGLKPKLHGLHHLSKELASQLRSRAPRVLSPLSFNCEANEDLVGRVSRLARKVSSRTVNHRVFDRLLCKTKALLRRKFVKMLAPAAPRQAIRILKPQT